MKKEELFELIENWDSFCEENTEHTLENFALWVLRKGREKLQRNQLARDTCYLISRAERYHKSQVKTLFQGLPLLGYEDFLLLNTVYHRPNISKTKLYESNIYDMNSGTQTVNRLKRDNLLIDAHSETDKRIHLLNITEEGKRVRNEAFKRFEKTLPKKFYALSDEELTQFNQTLQKVEKQFGTIARQTNKKSRKSTLS